MPNVAVHIFPGVLHGYMMRWNVKAFHAETRAFSMAQALALLGGLRGADERPKLRQAS
jgi:carboxymethylenebutenolidase